VAARRDVVLDLVSHRNTVTDEQPTLSSAITLDCCLANLERAYRHRRGCLVCFFQERAII
jgi:hypothetical protein